jgi:hypothetical protein
MGSYWRVWDRAGDDAVGRRLHIAVEWIPDFRPSSLSFLFVRSLIPKMIDGSSSRDFDGVTLGGPESWPVVDFLLQLKISALRVFGRDSARYDEGVSVCVKRASLLSRRPQMGALRREAKSQRRLMLAGGVGHASLPRSADDNTAIQLRFPTISSSPNISLKIGDRVRRIRTALALASRVNSNHQRCFADPHSHHLLLLTRLIRILKLTSHSRTMVRAGWLNPQRHDPTLHHRRPGRIRLHVVVANQL